MRRLAPFSTYNRAYARSRVKLKEHSVLDELARAEAVLLAHLFSSFYSGQQ